MTLKKAKNWSKNIEAIVARANDTPDADILKRINLAMALENLLSEAKTSQDTAKITPLIIDAYELEKHEVNERFQQISKNYQENLEELEHIKKEFELNETKIPRKRRHFISNQELLTILSNYERKELNKLLRQDVDEKMIIEPYETMLGIYLSEEDIHKASGMRRKKGSTLLGVTYASAPGFCFFGHKDNLKNKKIEQEVKDHEFKHLIDLKLLKNNRVLYLKEYASDLYAGVKVNNAIEKDIAVYEKQEQILKKLLKKNANSEIMSRAYQYELEQVTKYKNEIIENKQKLIELSNMLISANKKGLIQENSTLNPRVIAHIASLTPVTDLVKTIEYCIYKPTTINSYVKNKKVK